MNILRGIPHPVGGEHVLATLPALGPYPASAAGEPPLRKHLHLFPQRALTHTALIAEQHGRIANTQRLGQAVAPGIVDGLTLAIEGQTLVLMPGHAIAPDGQDVALAYPLHIAFDAICMASPRVDQALQDRLADASAWTRLSGLQRQATLRQVLDELDGAGFLPHAMVLVAVPRSIALDRGGELNSPCPNATDTLASSGAAWEDGLQLMWSPWPADRPLPLWRSDGRTVDARFRNRLAYAVFNAERERLSVGTPRSMREWRERAGWSQDQLDDAAAQAALVASRGAPWPWERLGVPLALVAFDADFKPVFADSASVARQGGGRRNRSALVPWSGDDVLWQARVSQLLEHLAELPAAQRNATALQQQFDWLPPAGVLPRDVADFATGRQSLFPPQFDVQAQPVPLDMVDALIAESSALLPYNLSLRDQVQLLVPVPARYYDPDLLKLDLAVHPLFDLEINRLSGKRLQLLTRRDGLRRRHDLLTQAVVGNLPAYPQDDLNALPDETGALDALAFCRVHLSTAAAGAGELHDFSEAHLPLDFQASDSLIVFVRIDSAPLGIGLRPLISATLNVPEVVTRPFIWGTAPAEANGDRVGDLPASGEWVQLTVPMSRAGLGRRRIDGLAFAIFGGEGPSQVTWGHAGKASNGLETVWVGDALPPGARVGGTWTWQTQGDASVADDDASYGLPIEPVPANAQAEARAHTRHVSELDQLLKNWANFQSGALSVELGEPKTGRTPESLPRTVDGGLDELITRLDGRIRTAGDHIDMGFLRARTDIFRLRQSVLGVEDAGRFLTSPAAAELVKRNDNPAATEKEFSDYFNRLSAAAVQPPDFKGLVAQPRGTVPAAQPRGSTLLASTRLTGTSAPASAFVGNTGLFSTAVATPRITTTPGAFTTLGNIDRVALDTGATTSGFQVTATGSITDKIGTLGALEIAPTVVSVKATAGLGLTRGSQLSVEAPPAVKDVVGASLIGATYNTVTVAERFTLPASVVSSNAAAKAKNDFVVAGLNGLAATGLVVDDIKVYGYGPADLTQPSVAITAREMLTGDFIDRDALDEGDDKHEAVYFRRGIDAIDNTIRFLRGVELRAEDYRRLQSDAKSARTRIQAAATRIQMALDALAVRLAEVRHDLSVARSLRTEEQTRIDALVAKRKTILAEQVPYLVFRRPRVTLTLQDVPLLAAQPADVADPVPRCRSEAHTPPPELEAMVDTLRDVPVRWLRTLSQVFVKLDRVVDLERVVTQAQLRIATTGSDSLSTRHLSLIEGETSQTGQLLKQTFERQSLRVKQSKQDATLQLSQFSASSWRQAIEPAQHIVNIRDLFAAGTLPRAVTLAAAGLLDDVGGVASCLHAALCSVPPVTRLRWAELFSQLDPAVSLRQLTVLPGFGDESLGVDHIVWRQMQCMVDWLFAQVVDETSAHAAINDLVRVCLLLAAHAPVKRILSARIQRPVPAVVNTRLDIAIDPATTRIGMQVLVHAPATHTLVARAVIEDLGAGTATARIVEAPAGVTFTLDSSMRVQVQSGTPLSTPQRQQTEADQARTSAVPASAIPKASGDTGRAEASVAAERLLAKQVDQLRTNSARLNTVR
ncbi:hypothetical protein LHU53_00900 [Rhodoferax sp. U2-2l]|uniref:hypothetical protein n=1 Tax=Rhodoferax sp. U2-2l TaxID=2884000 RepID=UPI001D0AA2AF|nr:hypothetical protein [Rhodoferax sp. U2-2l]MCB8745460.1 hypothetical protein [Rhodoferax sp. U2-2l]